MATRESAPASDARSTACSDALTCVSVQDHSAFHMSGRITWCGMNQMLTCERLSVRIDHAVIWFQYESAHNGRHNKETALGGNTSDGPSGKASTQQPDRIEFGFGVRRDSVSLGCKNIQGTCRKSRHCSRDEFRRRIRADCLLSLATDRLSVAGAGGDCLPSYQMLWWVGHLFK
jgi:hypothetical protein